MQQTIAMGGGGFLMEDTPLLDDFILSRGSASRVCFVATASGDSDRMLVNFYPTLGPRCRATHLLLFRRQHADVVAHLLAQDVIYVGGGDTPNMLAVWRIHVRRRLKQVTNAQGWPVFGNIERVGPDGKATRVFLQQELFGPEESQQIVAYRYRMARHHLVKA